MKLLKLSAPNGYKMLRKGFEINFLTKTRVSESSPNNDLLCLEPGLYYPIETAIVGKNSSGKSTTLELLAIALNLLRFGRVDSIVLDDNRVIELNILFHSEGAIYRYCAKLSKGEPLKSRFLRIEAESLEKTTLREYYKKDLSNASFATVPEFIARIGEDTSFLPHFTRMGKETFYYITPYYERQIGVAQLLFDLSLTFDEAVVNRLIRLFDDSVESIKPRYENGKPFGFLFKRVGQEEINVDGSFLETHLSTGTKRGLFLYGLSMALFHDGGHLLVDEIEKNFHKNLIGNLILMFNDKTINKAGASIVYSTHYSELLDATERCDNINILHREGCEISLKNMAADYHVRTQLLRSVQFDDNTFDNLLNYSMLMDLREALRNA